MARSRANLRFDVAPSHVRTRFIDDEACLRLAIALVKQFCLDYVSSDGTDPNAIAFFRYDRIFEALDIDGEAMMAALDKKVAAKRNAIEGG